MLVELAITVCSFSVRSDYDFKKLVDHCNCHLFLALRSFVRQKLDVFSPRTIASNSVGVTKQNKPRPLPVPSVELHLFLFTAIAILMVIRTCNHWGGINAATCEI